VAHVAPAGCGFWISLAGATVFFLLSVRRSETMDSLNASLD